MVSRRKIKEKSIGCYIATGFGEYLAVTKNSMTRMRKVYKLEPGSVNRYRTYSANQIERTK